MKNVLFVCEDKSVDSDLEVTLDRDAQPSFVGKTIPSSFDLKGKRVAISCTEREAKELILAYPETTWIFRCKDPQKRERMIAPLAPLAEGISFAKKLIEAPANLLPPEVFAKRVAAIEGLEVEIFEKGFPALEAVGKGSINPPRLVVIQYRGGSKEMDPIALVGKGVCFDAGGINLKTSHLEEMKWDKAGAGVVVGVMKTLVALKAPVNVVGVIGLAENMPDGAALKPGDVITMLSEKRVEVVDTDCEGRLILADCITYAIDSFSPKCLIDLGTLTLETFGALAGEYAGLFSNDEKLRDQLIGAGKRSGEKVWPLPLGKGFADQLKSKCADLKNCGIFRFGGSSAAAEFLHAFVQEGIPWAHLDISGVSWTKEGVTGWGIKLLVDWLIHTQQNCNRGEIQDARRDVSPPRRPQVLT